MIFGKQKTLLKISDNRSPLQIPCVKGDKFYGFGLGDIFTKDVFP